MITRVAQRVEDMLPDLNTVSAAIAFVVVIAVGTAGLWLMPVGMDENTILTMVLPSMVVFGGIMLAIGIAHGQYRSRQ